MAFGINREELTRWKQAVSAGEIAFLTHYWIDPRFPEITTVTKVGCSDLPRLKRWCKENGLPPQYIHNRKPFPISILWVRNSRKYSGRRDYGSSWSGSA